MHVLLQCRHDYLQGRTREYIRRLVRFLPRSEHSRQVRTVPAYAMYVCPYVRTCNPDFFLVAIGVGPCVRTGMYMPEQA